jgi:hypothetical protein
MFQLYMCEAKLVSRTLQLPMSRYQMFLSQMLISLESKHEAPELPDSHLDDSKRMKLSNKEMPPDVLMYGMLC